MGALDLNLRHLYLVLEVARRGSVSAAADSAALSQPALTQALGKIERSVGAPLFNRSNAGMVVNAVGLAFIERIERAVAQLREALTDVCKPNATQLQRIERAVTTAQLNALVSVVEHGSFSQAARAAGVSAPTMHRAARDLERLVGLALFERTSFGMQPTREAQRLARGAKLAFAEIDQARAELASSSGGASGRTVIGAMPLARSFLLPRVLVDFLNEHPLHAVSILEGPYDNLMAELRGGTADFLLGALRNPLVFKDVVQEHLFDDELAIIVRADHPLTKQKRVLARTLAKYPWITPRRESPLYEHFLKLFQTAGVTTPTSTIECNSLVAARSLLIESDRVMLLSVHQIHYDLKAGLLAALPHPHGQVTRAIALTTRLYWRPTQAQARLLALLRQQAARIR